MEPVVPLQAVECEREDILPALGARTGCAGVAVAAEAAPGPAIAVALRTVRRARVLRTPSMALRGRLAPAVRLRRSRSLPVCLFSLQNKRSLTLQLLMARRVSLATRLAVVELSCVPGVQP